LVLLSAHHTVEFLVLLIMWAGKMTMATVCFNVVKESTIGVAHTIRERLLICIHTLKGGTIMAVVLCQSTLLSSWRGNGIELGSSVQWVWRTHNTRHMAHCGCVFLEEDTHILPHRHS